MAGRIYFKLTVVGGVVGFPLNGLAVFLKIKTSVVIWFRWCSVSDFSLNVENWFEIVYVHDIEMRTSNIRTVCERWNNKECLFSSPQKSDECERCVFLNKCNSI